MSIEEDLLKTLIEQRRPVARAETALGEPFQLGESTVRPVVRVSVGLGGGRSRFPTKARTL